MRRLAVIPARGGSTRLKNKNIYPVAGKPLIRWITEAVVDSGCFDRVIISTDSDEIFDAVSDLPVDRHVRPASHATVRATVLEAMIDLMHTIEDEYDVFAYFLPTSPLTSVDDIKKGINKLTQDIDSVVSMAAMPEPIQKACIMKDDWVIPVFDNLTAGLTNSKFIKKYHTPNGSFYIAWWNKILENRNFFKGSVKGVLIPTERSVDIDDITDIRFAESILQK
jgi:CMP-N-acetylneuraminic acid synthetase